MKKYVHGFLLLAFMIPALMSLSGCYLASGDDLLQAPKQPEAFVELQPFLKKYTDAGWSYAAPVSGQNRQPIQLIDLDEDGNDEALVFLSKDTEPIRVYIYSLNDGVYEEVCYIEDDSESIESVTYADLDNGGCKEIVVGWKAGGLKSLVVYSYDNGMVYERLNADYTVYLIEDMTGDEIGNLVVIRHDAVNLIGVAELYGMRDGELSILSYAPLSQSIDGITRVITGNLSDGKKAVLVASLFGQDSTITDVIVLQEDSFVNISLNTETLISEDNIRQIPIGATDINGDGVITVPRPAVLPSYSEDSTESIYWTIKWVEYDSKGSTVPVLETFHNQNDGWYLEIPDSWNNKYVVTRRDTIKGERALVFAYNGNGTPVDLLILHTTTTARDNLPLGDRTIITQHGDTTVLASFVAPEAFNSAYVPDAEELSGIVKWIRSEWIDGATN